ncbi:MAG: PQQ-dependent sugar dehydrogenase [Candidatus Eisenbacteria bacterium]
MIPERHTLTAALHHLWAAVCMLALAGATQAAPVRAGFTETVVVQGFDSPVSMAFAPDGRVFVCEQGGALRVVKQGRLLPRPFVTVPTQAFEEEGLLGVAFDPAFARTHLVYVLYTALEPTRHNVIASYVAALDSATGPATIVFEFDTHAAHQHVGGALRFGRDGMLYASSGECGDGSLSQSLASTAGKILRIRPDGSIPGDNPFPTRTRGRHGAIWARGFRNAFTFDIHPSTGRMFVNDVGGSRYEEVNEVVKGGNYGWPVAEGPVRHASLADPVYAYTHDDGCAITGGAWYAPRAEARAAFPAAWRGGYFFAEYCANELRWLPGVGPARAVVFGKLAVAGPVDLRTAPDGSLWYLARGNSAPSGGAGSARGSLVRIANAKP